nr:MAG: replication associated protein [Cressdnaviricota sp.]
MSTTRRQGIFWMLTVPYHGFTPYLPPSCQWITGQLERGEGTTPREEGDVGQLDGGSGLDEGFLHWQLLLAFRVKSTLAQCRAIMGNYHAELSRSDAAREYVLKDATAVLGTRFDLGARPFRRNSRTDWDSVWVAAQLGDLLSIPPQVRVVSYRTIRAIASDHATPLAMVREGICFWGDTGTGKSRRAWGEAGMEAYSKDPRSKFWDGYTGQNHVVFDEFRGGIDVSHVLRWLDRYPCRVEVKGSSRPLEATKIWFTSNVDPRSWYPDLDPATLDALMRRLTVTHFSAGIIV